MPKSYLPAVPEFREGSVLVSIDTVGRYVRISLRV